MLTNFFQLYEFLMYFLPDVNEESLCIGLARVGSDEQQIVAATLKEMAQVDLGGPLHSLVIAGPELHPLETSYIEQFQIKKL